jgi:hypothetical protein
MNREYVGLYELHCHLALYSDSGVGCMGLHDTGTLSKQVLACPMVASLNEVSLLF